MVIGEYESKVDNKGRVAFPSKFRKEIGEELIITKGYEQTLIIITKKAWETLLEGTVDKPFIQKEIREVQRFLLGSASVIELDKKGRLLIPEYLRKFAGIEEDSIFLGLSKYIEMWSKKRWEVHKSMLEESIGRISERLIPWRDIKEVKHE